MSSCHFYLKPKVVYAIRNIFHIWLSSDNMPGKYKLCEMQYFIYSVLWKWQQDRNFKRINISPNKSLGTPGFILTKCELSIMGKSKTQRNAHCLTGFWVSIRIAMKLTVFMLKHTWAIFPCGQTLMEEYLRKSFPFLLRNLST